MRSASPFHYHSFAIILHWVMALSFLAMLTSGFVMAGVDSLDHSLKFKLYQLHKSGGVVLLMAFFVRLVMRLLVAPPPLPDGFKKVEVLLAKFGHIALYVFMIAMPITGWVVVSSSSTGLPTIVFNLFEWPHIPGLEGNKAVHEVAEGLHELFAYGFAGMIILHVAAVVKHAVVEKENLLTRMWWGRS